MSYAVRNDRRIKTLPWSELKHRTSYFYSFLKNEGNPGRRGRQRISGYHDRPVTQRIDARNNFRHSSRVAHGVTVTITRLYLVNAGVPLSLTFRMKWIVFSLSTTGAVTGRLYRFGEYGLKLTMPLYVPASGY